MVISVPSKFDISGQRIKHRDRSLWYKNTVIFHFDNEKQLEYSNQNPEILQECKPNYILNDISELI